MDYPENYYFTLEREWVHLIDDNTAHIGLTELAIKELEPIKQIEIHTIGQHLKKNQVFGRVRSDTILCKLIMPFDGIIVKANTPSLDNPDFINSTGFYKQWIISVKLRLPIDKTSLFSLDTYKAHKTDRMFHLITYLLPKKIV